MFIAKDFMPDQNDFIIVVMGPTGTGKSNFINRLTGRTEGESARGLNTDTQKVVPYDVRFNGTRLVLVDTPGFDDTYRSDGMILRIVADWLTQKYRNGETLRISGIVYLHRITDNRMNGSALKNLQMFGRLCGDTPLRRARLVTTRWDLVTDHQKAEQREKELSTKFWKELLDVGVIAKRFYNSESSAREIVTDLLAMGRQDGRNKLLLQEELVDQQKRLYETRAAKVIYSRLQKLLEVQKNTLNELANVAKTQNDTASAEDLQDQYEKINEDLQRTVWQIKRMKVPPSRRFIL